MGHFGRAIKINARSDEFTNKPAFPDAWKKAQRYLVIADAFYEWKKITLKEKQSYAIAMADDSQMIGFGPPRKIR